MFKAIFLLLVIGGLSWLGYTDYKKTNSADSTLSQTELSGEELVKDVSEFFGTLWGKVAGSIEGLGKDSSGSDADAAGTEKTSSDAADTAEASTSAAENAVSDAANTASEAVGEQVENATDAANSAVESVTETASDASDAVESAAEDAKEAVAGVATGPLTLSGVTRKIGGAIGTTTSLLSGVSDEASATAALPKLTAVSEGLSEVAQGLPDIPDAAKAPLSTLISSGVDRITPLSEKALSIPGVSDILQPVLGPMMETLTGMSE